MPRRFFRRVSGGYLRNEHPWVLHPFRTLITHPTFFSVGRRSVAGAIWLGVFIALLPVPGQTLIALLAALLLRINLPLAGIIPRDHRVPDAVRRQVAFMSRHPTSDAAKAVDGLARNLLSDC